MLRAYRLFCLWRNTPQAGLEVDSMRELDDVTTDLTSRFEAHGVPFVVGGAFALAARGTPRFTYNLDLMILAPLQRAREALEDPRYEEIGPVTYRETTTDLYLDLHPVEDAAQRWAADQAETVDVLGESVPVLTAEGLALMLLREASQGEKGARPLRLRDVELLAREPGLDWETILGLVRQMGYEEAYKDVHAPGKPPG